MVDNKPGNGPPNGRLFEHHRQRSVIPGPRNWHACQRGTDADPACGRLDDPGEVRASKRSSPRPGPFYAADPGQEYASRLAGAGLTYAEQVLEPSLAASATIFHSPDGEEACVAFRGSTSVSNFRSMFALGLVP